LREVANRQTSRQTDRQTPDKNNLIGEGNDQDIQKTYSFILWFGRDLDEAADSDGDGKAERQVDGFSERPHVQQ